MSGNAPSANPLSYAGVLPNFPTNLIKNNRAPLPTDINANLGDEWEDLSVTPSNFYKLANLYYGTATWILITGQGGGGNISWSKISSSQTLQVSMGYICIAPGGALSLALPAVSSLGNIIEITLDGATSFTITQGAGQSIRIGNLATTAGIGGSLTSTQQGDSIRMVCQTANLKWNVVSSMGNPTIV